MDLWAIIIHDLVYDIIIIIILFGLATSWKVHKYMLDSLVE